MTTAAHPPSRARILDSALALFAERGYDATSVREICDAAGITKPTLYHFFGSKEGLYRAIVGGPLERLHEDVAALLGGTGTFDERLGRVTRMVFTDAQRNPRLWRFTFASVWSATSAPTEELHALHERVKVTMGAAFEDAVRAGELKSGSTEARLLVVMGTVSEALANFLTLGRPELSNSLADALVEAMVGAWRADADSRLVRRPPPARRGAAKPSVEP